MHITFSESDEVVVNKKKGLLEGILGHVDLNSKEGKKLLQTKSRNVGALKLVNLIIISHSLLTSLQLYHLESCLSNIISKCQKFDY